MAATSTPHVRLFAHPDLTITISAVGHITVLERSTGRILQSTANSLELSAKVLKSGLVVTTDATVTDDGTRLATATSDKLVRVWAVGREQLEIVGESEVPKKPTCVRLTKGGDTVLVSDKFGDLHSFPAVTPIPSSVPATRKAKLNDADEEQVSGTLLLGHVSLLTTFLLTPDERYVITADRDEHVRVSWYPQAYTIEIFCLGHKKFVSALHIPSWAPTQLISGGGDDDLFIWDWLSGTQLCAIAIAQTVTPFIKVIRAREGKGEGEGEDGDGVAEGGEAAPRKKGMSARQRRKARGREKRARDAAGAGPVTEDADPAADGGADVGSALDEVQGMDIDADADALTAPPADERAANARGRAPSSLAPPALVPEPVLAVHKIVTIEVAGVRWLLFSAFGATALFYSPYPSTPFPPASSSVPPAAPATPLAPEDVYAVDLGRPVLDFEFMPTASEGGTGNEVWVLIDGVWSDVSSGASEATKEAVCVLVFDGGKLTPQSTSHTLPALLSSLLSLTTSQPPPMTLPDLYTQLAILPKNVHATHSAMDDADVLSLSLSAPGGDTSPGVGASLGSGTQAPSAAGGSRPLSKKELGRLKSKRAQLAHAAALARQEGSLRIGSGGDREGEGQERGQDLADTETETSGREAKKPRSDASS